MGASGGGGLAHIYTREYDAAFWDETGGPHRQA